MTSRGQGERAATAREAPEPTASEQGVQSGGALLRRRPVRGRCVALTGAETFLGRNVVGLLEED